MTDDTRRHWHGTPGSRHEHHNVWTHGGSKGPAARAPWALTPEMTANANANANARRGSDTSTTSATSATNTTNNSAGSPTSPPTVSERRRSSNASGERGLFANLHSQKRESVDPSMAGRRASWNEQREQGGFFAKWWDGYTRGPK